MVDARPVVSYAFRKQTVVPVTVEDLGLVLTILRLIFTSAKPQAP